jgi:hypothetical protein
MFPMLTDVSSALFPSAPTTGRPMIAAGATEIVTVMETKEVPAQEFL